MNDTGINPMKAPPKQTSFGGDILKLFTGSTVAQTVTILVAPILTRLYGPEAFGELALFTSISSVLAVIACLSYEYAIVLPENDGDAANLLGASIGFTILFSVLTMPAIWIWGDDIAQLLRVPALVAYLWLLPLSILFAGLFAALNYWNSRTKHFGRLSIVRITQSLVTTSTTLSAGYAGYSTGGAMIGASVGGQIIATSILGIQIWGDNKNLFRSFIHWRNMVENMRQYRKFPIFYTGAMLINTTSNFIPIFLLSLFFSPNVVGLYALGLRVLQLPMSLIGGTIGQVFFQRAVEAYQKGELASLVEKIFTFLIIIGLFPILILGLIARDLFTVVFGPAWTEAGIYVQIMSVSISLFFISSPLTVLTAALEKQKFSLLTATILFIFRSLSFLIAGALSDARLGILLFSISGAFFYGSRIFFINKYAGVSYRKTAKIAFWGIIPFIPVMFIFWLLTICEVATWVFFVMTLILISVYMYYIVLTQKQIMNYLRLVIRS